MIFCLILLYIEQTLGFKMLIGRNTQLKHILLVLGNGCCTGNIWGLLVNLWDYINTPRTKQCSELYLFCVKCWVFMGEGH